MNDQIKFDETFIGYLLAVTNCKKTKDYGHRFNKHYIGEKSIVFKLMKNGDTTIVGYLKLAICGDYNDPVGYHKVDLYFRYYGRLVEIKIDHAMYVKYIDRILVDFNEDVLSEIVNILRCKR